MLKEGATACEPPKTLRARWNHTTLVKIRHCIFLALFVLRISPRLIELTYGMRLLHWISQLILRGPQRSSLPFNQDEACRRLRSPR